MTYPGRISKMLAESMPLLTNPYYPCDTAIGEASGSANRGGYCKVPADVAPCLGGARETLCAKIYPRTSPPFSDCEAEISA
jgi:hypothetical protein